MPKISVIVPVYNTEKYLRRCIDSILGQTFTDFELILVDDGSLDNCPQICDEYAAKDRRVIVIHKRNEGVSAARNCGLDVAQGTYIAFCDSDDYWDLSYLNQLVHEIEWEKADCVVSNYIILDEEGEKIGQSKHYESSKMIVNQEERRSYLLRDILGGKTGWEVWTRLFRSTIIQGNNIRFCTTCGNYAEDLEFTLEYCLYAKKVCCIGYSGYYYVKHKGSMMQRSKKVVKLSQLNEVSVQFGRRFSEVFGGSKNKRNSFPIFHFLIMWTEYQKMIGNETYKKLSDEIRKIENKTWYRKQTKGLFKCKKMLVYYFGKRVAKQMLLLSHYCLHGNWKRFCVESAIAYRWFIKQE